MSLILSFHIRPRSPNDVEVHGIRIDYIWRRQLYIPSVFAVIMSVTDDPDSTDKEAMVSNYGFFHVVKRFPIEE